MTIPDMLGDFTPRQAPPDPDLCLASIAIGYPHRNTDPAPPPFERYCFLCCSPDSPVSSI